MDTKKQVLATKPPIPAQIQAAKEIKSPLQPSHPMALGRIQPQTKMVRLPPSQPALPRPAGQRPLVQPASSQFVGKYRILKLIGAGGMGAVYLAVHPQMNKQVVIKKLRTDRSSKSLRDRFFREADDLMRLSNPHIVKMYDYFSDRGGDYIVLEYIEGMALDKLLKKQDGKLPVPLAVQIFLDTCHGLRAAHANGIIHRDIKPANVLLSKRSEVKLADFGIAGREDDKGGGLTLADDAKTLEGPSSDFVTKTGTVLGTPAYMSPEQLEDSSSVDRRSDIYSMGVMLYQMLTGEKPFGSEYNETTRNAIKKGKYIPPKHRNRKIPWLIDRMIRRMMAVKKEDRYKKIDDVIKRCEAYMSGFTSATRREIRKYAAKSVREETATEYPLWRPIRRYAVAGIASLALPILLLMLHGSGILRASVLRPFYEPVEFTARMPDADAGPEVRIEIYRAAPQELLKGPASPRRMSVKSSGVAESNVYLPKGEYRIRLTAGQYAVWQDFAVDGNGPVSVRLDGLPTGCQDLDVRISAHDAVTGEDVTERTSFYMLEEGRWVPLQDARPKSGGKVSVRAICPGYAEEVREVSAGWNETNLMIWISMEPESRPFQK